MTHACITKLDAHLKARKGEVLSLGFGVAPGKSTTYLRIATSKADRGNPGRALVFATFCPFCGAKFRDGSLDVESEISDQQVERAYERFERKNLVIMIQRLARALKKADPSIDLPDKASGMLKQLGIKSQTLRSKDEALSGGGE